MPEVPSADDDPDDTSTEAPSALVAGRSELDPTGRAAARAAVADGLAEREAHEAGRVVLTRRGRLLADAVVRGLTG